MESFVIVRRVVCSQVHVWRNQMESSGVASPDVHDSPIRKPWPIADAARFLDLSDRHLRRLLDLGLVRDIRFGRRRLIPDAEVRRIAEAGVGALPGCGGGEVVRHAGGAIVIIEQAAGSEAE
jgi:excisionase family DNA binding protein